jgi:hypothetical protein
MTGKRRFEDAGAGLRPVLRFFFLRVLKGYSAYDPINYVAVNSLLKHFFKRRSLS